MMLQKEAIFVKLPRFRGRRILSRMAQEPVIRRALRAGAWYRVKSSGQFCRIQRIPSSTDPAVSTPAADEGTRGFELALDWYTPRGTPVGTPEGTPPGAPAAWTRRVMIMPVKKALLLLQEPLPADQAVLEELRKVAGSLPVSYASRDGELTWNV